MVHCFSVFAHLFRDDQDNGSGVGNTMYESFFPVLSIVQALSIPEDEDILAIHFGGCKLLVDQLDKSLFTLLYMELIITSGKNQQKLSNKEEGEKRYGGLTELFACLLPSDHPQ